MKKFLVISPLLVLISIQCFSQQPVIDVGVISTLVINHEAQQIVLEDIKEKETEISAAQKTIAIKMEQIRVLEERVYNSMRTVQSVVQNAKDIVYASTIAEDIGKYQTQMFEIAKDDPELMVVAANTQIALMNRTTDLFVYIATAVKDGDENLLDNKQRLDLIKHVVNELRVMRGMAYGICRRMRVAKRAGLYRTLNPLSVEWPDNGAAIVESLLEDFNRR